KPRVHLDLQCPAGAATRRARSECTAVHGPKLHPEHWTATGIGQGVAPIGSTICRHESTHTLWLRLASSFTIHWLCILDHSSLPLSGRLGSILDRRVVDFSPRTTAATWSTDAAAAQGIDPFPASARRAAQSTRSASNSWTLG